MVSETFGFEWTWHWIFTSKLSDKKMFGR